MPRRRRSKKGRAGVPTPALVLGGLVIAGGGLALALWLSQRRSQTVPRPELQDQPFSSPPDRPAAPAPSSPSSGAPPAATSPSSFPTAGPGRAAPPSGTWERVARFDDTQIERSLRVLTWEGDLSTDADGSPHAYHPDDWGPLRGVGPSGDIEVRAPKGLDAPENAAASRAEMARPRWQDVRKWAGIAVDKGGRPIIQGPNDPAPGYFVSTTALGDPRFASGNPRRYVDAEQINYLSVPKEILGLGAKKGDLAAVEFGGRVAFAIVADVGPAGKIGEGSIALVRALGFEGNARGSRDKPDRGFRTYLFLGSGDGKPHPQAEIDARAQLLYERLRKGVA